LAVALAVLVVSACALGFGADRPSRVEAVPLLTVTARRQFSITARAKGLFPGATRPLRVRVRNPFRRPIKVTAIRVSVKPDPRRPLCRPRRYIRTTKMKRPLTIRAGHSRGRRLRITMLRRAPDGCQGAVFRLRLEGRATRP
jgi:hypothetical protein